MSLSNQNSYSSGESFELTALQYAAKKGSLEQIKFLTDSGVNLDSGPDPALHLALRKRNVGVANVLLQIGAEFEGRDSKGDCPIHIACTLGLVEIVKQLCALGCNLETPNSKGLHPLHLASKYGHIEVVRYLCSAGCNIEARNWENIRADITALKYGNNNISDLLDKLRIGGRDILARQLVPTSKPAIKPLLRLLGNCGVGKTALVKSLSAGLFTSLFKRSSSLQSNKSRPSSPVNVQIEMDVTSRKNSLNFETSANYQSTGSVNVQTLDISGLNDISVVEFSGQEIYFPIYHNFLWPNAHSLTAILFNLEDPPSVQVQQVVFWLNFLMARQPADFPTDEYGDIVLVATHVDKTRAGKGNSGEWISPDAQKTLETVQNILPHVPNLKSHIIVMDCNVPSSFAFKQLKCMLANLKNDTNKKSIGTWTGLLESTLTWLKTIQKQYEQFPVLSRSTFSELLRNQVNILATEEHITELLLQLVQMGELFCVYDHIVISVAWLGAQLLEELLSDRFMELARITGVYTVDDFQASFNHYDAIGVLNLLEDMSLCVRCDLDGEIEYEFPIYNKIGTIDGLWDASDPRYGGESCYGGVRLFAAPETFHMLKSIFYFVQVDLRRAIISNLQNNDTENDLYQWCNGSKLCNQELESLITLEEENSVHFIEIKIRGPTNSSKNCFFFMEQILYIIENSIYKTCPGLLLERHLMSAKELKMHFSNPFVFPSSLVISTMLEAENVLDALFFNENLRCFESITQLILFGDEELSSSVHWGCGLKIRHLPAPCKLKLCGMLDPPEPHGRDWCLLALKVGLCQDKIASLDSQHSSHTMRLLGVADCSIGALITSLHELDRLDALEVVQRSSPIFKLREFSD